MFSQFVLSDLQPVKDGPYRPLPGGQKLDFCLAVFHKNFNILSVKSNHTSTWKMEFWECGIADKVLKVIFENTYLWVTFGKSFIFCVFMLTYLFLVLKRSLDRNLLLYLCYCVWLFSNTRFKFLVKLFKHRNNCSMYGTNFLYAYFTEALRAQ